MYKFFTIKNFKNFKSLELNDLERVNLIVGKNNSGKSSLLEAILLHNMSIASIISIIKSRNTDLLSATDFKHIIQAFFNNFNTKEPIDLIGFFENNKKVSVSFRLLEKEEEIEKINIKIDLKNISSLYPKQPYVLQAEHKEDGNIKNFYLVFSVSDIIPSSLPVPKFPVFFLPTSFRTSILQEVALYSQLRSENYQDKIIKYLRIIEPKINSIEILNLTGKPALYGDVGLDKPILLSFLGEGMSRLTNILLAIGVSKNGAVLIDEIENGFHYSVLKDVWKAISEMAREFNVQVFATTHSYECIQNAHLAFKESDVYDFRVVRLDKIDDQVKPVVMNQEDLDTALELGFEIR
ncbi:MAG TPA: ATPase [Sulfurihydrogenibium sp.]|uniref:AAA family ATPase n=1 Tax=Sulfurihydrogenibium sp. (strain YO3AOP1) TaxID=436114 RepID=UPI0001723F23|nr:ATP-binding protein [Sulfurihydrogenibium sp. YO3AOP1]ACD66129.1 ATPase-like protein [Sulfurihydrogenibium sp. YO3AOP1]HBT98435.1 ATPase [Sulfurihydrogenibium sp.]